MTTTMLRRDGQISEILLGSLGARVNLRGYDGVDRETRGNATTAVGAALTSGNYGLIEQTTHGKNIAVPLIATAATAALTPANSVLLVDEAGSFIGAGKVVRLYDAVGTDYAQLVADADGGLELGGSGANSGRLYLGNGTAPLPSLSFSSDPDTGMYRVSANRIGFAAGGSKVVEIANDAGTFGVGIGMQPSVPLDVQRSSTDWVARIDQTHTTTGGKVLRLTTAETTSADAVLSVENATTTLFAVQANGTVNGLPWVDASASVTLTQSGAPTYTVQRARYVILGKLVVMQIRIDVTATGAAVANNSVVVGVPAAVTAAAAGQLIGTAMLTDISVPLVYQGAAFASTATGFTCFVSGSTAVAGAAGGLFTAALANGDVIRMDLAYEIA